MRIHLALLGLALTTAGISFNTYAEGDEKIAEGDGKTYFVYWCRVQETTYKPPLITKLSNIIVANHSNAKGLQKKAKAWAESTPPPEKIKPGKKAVSFPDDPYMICGAHSNADQEAVVKSIKKMKMVRAGNYQIIAGASASEYFDDAIEEVDLSTFLKTGRYK